MKDGLQYKEWKKHCAEENEVEISYIEIDNRKVKLVLTPLPGVLTGCYDFTSDTIFINKKIKKYPYVYQDTLEHEMEHAKNKDGGFIHTWIDLKDVFLTSPKGWVEFLKSYKPDNTKVLRANILTWSIILAAMWLVFELFTFIIEVLT